MVPMESIGDQTDTSDGPTRRRRAADERQAIRRREIVDASATLFQTRGYYATSVGDIADQVGMSKPAIYHYFRSKEEILVYIHEMIAERLLGDHHKVRSECADPVDRLRALCESFFAVMTDLQPHVRTFFAFFGEIEGGHRERIEGRRRELSEMVERAITDCIDDGQFRTVDPRLAMLAITGVFNWAPNWYHPNGRTSGEELADSIFEIFLNGLKADVKP